MLDLHTIRNKYTHEPHNMRFSFSTGGVSICSMGIYYKKKLLNISTISLSPLVYYLNKTFYQLRENILLECSKYNEMDNHSYIEEIKNFDLENKGYHILPEYLIY